MDIADTEQLEQWVRYLSETIGRRPATRPDLLNRVADHLTERFIELGFSAEQQPVPGPKNTLYNIIAAPAGIRQVENIPLLIVGAHYDTVSTTPGADDNASGIAALMELARICSGKPPPSLRLVAFCPEEPPAFRTRRMGSYVYARSLKRKKFRVRGMICLEMIGFFTDAPASQSYPIPFMNRIYPSRGNFLALVGNLTSMGWTRRVYAAFSNATDLPVERLNAPSIVFGIDFSDHWSFNRMHYPALMATDTAFYRNPHYHKPSDRPATLDYARMAKVVDGLATAVKLLG